LPLAFGGAGVGGAALCDILRQIGSGSLPLGRLFEGHVNAVGLVLRYGSADQISLIARETHEGKMSGVWNTDDNRNLRLISSCRGQRLEGRKILASGAGHIERPIITATDEQNRRFLVMPRLHRGERADLSSWTAHGMRASATGAVDFSGIEVDPVDILGGDGDYERQPAFSGGAWRFAAVHLGGMERLFDLLRKHMRGTGRGADPHQAARLGQDRDSEALGGKRRRHHRDAGGSANARPGRRLCQSRPSCCRTGMPRSHGVGPSVDKLASVYEANPVERISRDLGTYLRQPGPDRALTNAAAWLLERDAPIFDVWR
jgi:alkylation response protein AidB-like acyl-CoA dehydrogenase